jgi:hypothetical protein
MTAKHGEWWARRQGEKEWGGVKKGESLDRTYLVMVMPNFCPETLKPELYCWQTYQQW